MSGTPQLRRELNELARLHGLLQWYEAIGGTRRHASAEAIFLALRALGAPLETPRDVPAALAERRAQLHAEGTSPVHIAWDGRLTRLPIRLPASVAAAAARATLRLESGEIRRWEATFQAASDSAAGVPRYNLEVPEKLPLGYHELALETRRGTHRTRIISAPRRAQAPPAGANWGVFAPLYALRTRGDDGAGDFSDLQRLARWTSARGGAYVGTLPLLAAFVTRPFQPSPYAPVSRLFWNEFYVAGAAGARSAAEAGDPALVDYRAVGQRRRQQLAADAADLLRQLDSPQLMDFRRFVASRPRLADYARFRAVCDRQGEGWRAWPERLREGELQAGDWDPADEQYYLYAQWRAAQQLAELGDPAAGAAALYLDLPLGVNPEGYDAWRFRDLFVEGAMAGAPPDTLFTGGQNWGFHPFHPARLRASGYQYLIETLRHHLRHARMLRLDHVMSLFRLYWIPAGLSAREGVYVRYPAAELLAVLLTESVRHTATIIGEDLGTVPRAVRRAMEQRRIMRMFVLQYELAPGSKQPLNTVPRHAIASINTHDMPTFAGFVRAADVADQLELGLVAKPEAEAACTARARLVERLTRYFGVSHDRRALLEALLRHLAASDAWSVLVNLEDLWLEESAQNVPGTDAERPNWRHRFARTLETIMADESIAATLQALSERRSGRHAPATQPVIG